MTETGHGSNVADLETTARYAPAAFLPPGIHIEDCGEKLGLNGVDNGRIAFDHVRVPLEALLDRFAAVAADGSYTSPIASPGRRFFTMLGTLVGGRVSVALASLSAAARRCASPSVMPSAGVSRRRLEEGVMILRACYYNKSVALQFCCAAGERDYGLLRPRWGRGTEPL